MRHSEASPTTLEKIKQSEAHGRSICICGHKRNEHSGSCLRIACDCLKFKKSNAPVNRSDPRVALLTVMQARRVNSSQLADLLHYKAGGYIHALVRGDKAVDFALVGRMLKIGWQAEAQDIALALSFD